MPRLVVLFNLKPGVSEADYEAWAKTVDIPTAGALQSVDGFTLHRAVGVFGSDRPPPYRYVEIVDVNELALLGEEAGRPPMTEVTAKFAAFADNPLFLITEDV